MHLQILCLIDIFKFKVLSCKVAYINLHRSILSNGKLA